MIQNTELVFILDKSGSMAGLESDTIGGFNAMLEKQKAIEAPCRITTVLFDNGYDLLHDRSDIKAVAPLTKVDYQVGGSTALLDAIGQTVKKIKRAQAHTARNDRADKVMVVIITDGAENASRKYSLAQIKQLIGAQKELGWEFVFLGANIDSVTTAGNFGIAADRAMDYVSDSVGTDLNYRVMSEAVAHFRTFGKVDAAAFDAIREDKKKRGQ